MIERFEFHFATVTGFHVKLDFYNKKVEVNNRAFSYNLSADFTSVRANFGTIEVFYELAGTPILHLSYAVDARYIEQIQRFLA